MSKVVKCPYGVYNSVEIFGNLCECSCKDTEENMKGAVTAFNQEFWDIPECHITKWQA